MINLVLSRSQQASNKCVMGDTEQDHTGLIAEAIYQKLKDDARFNVYVIPKLSCGDDISNLYEAVRLSNDFIYKNGGQGYHLSIHTDGGYPGRGASGFYLSEEGRVFGLPIFQAMSELTPWKDMSFNKRAELFELKKTLATAFLLEVSFHDQIEQAKWIHDNVDNIATSIVLGIYKAVGLNLEVVAREGKSLSLNDAVKVLSGKGIIDTPLYWVDNAVTGKTCNGGYVEILIKNVAKKLNAVI